MSAATKRELQAVAIALLVAVAAGSVLMLLVGELGDEALRGSDARGAEAAA